MARIAQEYVEEAYTAHGEAVQRYLLRRHRRAEAEDLLQETFLQAIRHTPRLAAARCPRAWLMGVARHLSLSAMRSAKRHAPLDEGLLAASAVSDLASDQTDDRIAAMRCAINNLPDTQREVLLLRLQDELSYEQIAQVVGVPVGTVRSRIHYAIRRLREQLTANIAEME